jgi:hypothetical protein
MMSHRDYPKCREYVGAPCGHCGSHNTVKEVYNFSREFYCLTCARYGTFEVPSGKTNSTEQRPNEVSRVRPQ